METALEMVRVRGNAVDLESLGVKAPASTWTYLVNDDPFRDRIGALLTGPGGATVAIYAAVMMMPLLVLWGLIDRYFGKGSRRGG